MSLNVNLINSILYPKGNIGDKLKKYILICKLEISVVQIPQRTHVFSMRFFFYNCHYYNDFIMIKIITFEYGMCTLN